MVVKNEGSRKEGWISFYSHDRWMDGWMREKATEGGRIEGRW